MISYMFLISKRLSSRQTTLSTSLTELSAFHLLSFLQAVQLNNNKESSSLLLYRIFSKLSSLFDLYFFVHSVQILGAYLVI